MCHNCGAELTQPKEDKKKHCNLKSNPSDTGGSLWACKACAEKQERESLKQGYVISMPVISPMTSLSSTDSCVSSCSKLPSFLYVLHFGQHESTIVVSILTCLIHCLNLLLF